MVIYFKQNQKLRGAERREQSREERASGLDWVGVIRVKRIKEYQNEWIK